MTVVKNVIAFRESVPVWLGDCITANHTRKCSLPLQVFERPQPVHKLRKKGTSSRIQGYCLFLLWNLVNIILLIEVAIWEMSEVGFWWGFLLLVFGVFFFFNSEDGDLFFTAVMRQRYLWVFPVCYQLLARISDKLFKETFKGQCYKTTTLCQSLCSSKAGPVSFCIQIEPQRKIITGFPQLKFFLWLSVPFHYRLCYMHSNGFLLLI